MSLPGELSQFSDTPHEVPSYGIHRFSTASRLVVTFALVAALSALILVVLQVVVDTTQNYQIEPVIYVVFVLASILAVVLATIVGLYSARGITRPISIITDTVNEIKGENYQARTGLSGFDEIGRLGRTLDEMAETIQRNSDYERQITVDVAHELRTPLMAMQANLEAMIDGVMSADAEHLITVNSEVVRLGRLVEGQLKLSRLEARKVEISPRRLDLGELITRLMSNYELLVEDSGLGLEYHTNSNVFITADADLIRQATANLLSNAVRYTPEGGTIKVLVQKRGNWAEIVVEDTGIGISKEDQDNIFSKFWRATGDRNRDHGGLGIGLAMVREIVNMHGGKITVQSELGKGSKFTVALPIST
ncbi:hypothetical protein FACS1894104_0800 [Actinomycetota bacterium]|nr:hypothetical protein FACS1894104_0800 [Actinomycetota bacterium]